MRSQAKTSKINNPRKSLIGKCIFFFCNFSKFNLKWVSCFYRKIKIKIALIKRKNIKLANGSFALNL